MAYSTTRQNLHRVVVHVLGRRRAEVGGHFGLRASPGGIATPAFGPEPEVLRLAGPSLVREIGAEQRSHALDGATLAELARFAGADLGGDFSAGPDSPPVGSAGSPLRFEPDALAVVADWFHVAWRVLDRIVADAPLGESWSATQLWPEHFDAASSLDRGEGRGVTLGFSAGDAYSEHPYAYVSLWEPERPGDASYWNAPFGAAWSGTDEAAGEAFLRRGIDLLAGEED